MSRAALRAVAAVTVVAAGAGAQTRPAPAPVPAAPRDSVRPPAQPADTAARPARQPRGPRRTAAGAAPRPGLKPPISPRRALISSFLVPGLGQTRLDRPTTGAFFAAVEIASIAMINKSLADLRAARALRADSVTTTIPVDSLGVPTAGGTQTGGIFTTELVRARGLHVEDWVAVLFFNHLISGAEAFVSAQLYDLPAQISASPTPRGGALLAVSVAW